MHAGTARLLQEQVGTLQASLPNLTPSFLPASTERDLLRLAELEGRAGEQALLEILAAAGEDVQECSICSEPGEFAIDPEHQGSESTLLRPTFCFSVVIAQKLLIPTKCVFACGLCRQLRHTTSLLHELTMEVPAAGEEATAVGLLEHLAIINEREDLVGDEASLIAWGQENLSRAYALHVSLSAEHGWKLAHPDKTPFKGGKPGQAADIALQLLLPELSAEEREVAMNHALEHSVDRRSQKHKEAENMSR